VISSALCAALGFRFEGFQVLLRAEHRAGERRSSGRRKRRHVVNVSDPDPDLDETLKP
jgi:hypothetical protein